MFVPFMVPVFTVTVFDLNTQILEMTKAVTETFNGVKRFDHSVDFTRERLFSNLNNITRQMGEIKMRIDNTGKQLLIKKRASSWS